MTIYLGVSIQYTSVTDRQIAGRTPIDGYDNTYAWRRAAKDQR